MDDFFTHLAHLPRRFPARFPLLSAGYVADKRAWVRRGFTTSNFSFVLKGGGRYHRKGRTWEVRAPCVITQEPGIPLEYGPSEPWKSWEELFLIYDGSQHRALLQCGLMSDERPVWPIHDPARVRRQLTELVELLKTPQGHGNANRIDRVAEFMVLESLLGRDAAPADHREAAVRAIRALVEEHFCEEHDFDGLALHHGLSPSTFRRQWERHFRVPPARHVMRLRIREACRLLVETRMTIGEIAAALKFRDPLYFSRRFRQETGSTATGYRRRHQTPLSLR